MIDRRIGDSATIITKLLQENQALREIAREDKFLIEKLSTDYSSCQAKLKEALAQIERLENSNINGHAEFLTEEEANPSQDQPVFIDIQNG
mmetsp:Transcript_25006/g.38824  ORF Transcript_25006/g.38824 Transcript_25006/m.38824 type:complete len:91 (+) Transcript_25006:1254-1526(+)